MPLYEYECSACGHRFETIQKFADPPIEACPKCGGPVRKMQSAPAFQFKGSGWYVTDYARKDQSQAAKADGEKGPGASAGEKSAGKTGETPGGKTDGKSGGGEAKAERAPKPDKPAKGAAS